ncbi:phosphoenolpyruvate--protein phosphotransferase [Algimonas porphyrae]|uniref:phosphoenolpyruvate--protein phosphotransferase n=2 Tax=Algimonas porphyrae TaxID=1128113 RepID=A0ABQ5V3G5_9PROT|nr:phosphoenolpyruvate--protein phosphotransferase [Algimonas porphyrae]
MGLMSINPDIVTTPPRLMRAIRAAMEGTESVQERLDDFVAAISSSMRVNVASIYLLRQGEELELSATQGLKRSAVHKTRMKPGEGLVGHVALTARPLNLADAPSHPLFSYRPETGEDPFKSFLGVPILRGGRTLGVLVVQSKDARSFSEDEVEDMLTVAMVLAEIIVDDERVGGKKAALKGISLAQTKPETLSAKAFAPGLARGYAVLHRPPVAPANLLAENIAQEELRLEDAITRLRAHVDAMVSGEAATLTRASKEIYEAYRTFAYDRKWVGRLREAVHSGLTSEAAVERVRNEHRARLMKVRDPYLRARLHDLEDLANRMLRLLSGDSVTPDIPDDAILFARELGPAELLDYDRDKLAAVVLEEGTLSSHTSIIARALGLPLIGRATGVLDRIETGDDVLVDAEDGFVHLRPLETQVSGFQMRLNIRGEMSRAYDQLRFRRTITRDGLEVDLMLNAGLLVDLPQLDQAGADGIGLFRTEFQFMVSDFMPRLNQQTELYRKAIMAAGDRPVTFRTLDLGGDKILPYIDPVPEENPAMGWRAIRIGLDRPGLMRYQLRALVAAGAGRHLRVMFPMVTTVEEMVDARALFDREIERAKKLGQELPSKVEVGVMLETPALAWQINAVCDVADFVSVGANDLMQFFFAADRDNARVADRYDPLSPAALSILSYIAEGCRINDTPVSVCGEIAGRPLEAACLVALGFDTLSMPVTGIGPVKSALMAIDASELRELILPNIKVTTRLPSLRGLVRDYCLETGVPL